MTTKKTRHLSQPPSQHTRQHQYGPLSLLASEAEGALSERPCLSRPDTSMAPPPAVKAAFEWQMVADNVGHRHPILLGDGHPLTI